MRNLIQRISDFPSTLLRTISRRSRNGSVLILVVVLIVLLALMGTALLSTTRNDRYVAAQNSANTEVDMLLEGVKQIAISTVTDPNNRFDSVNWNWDMPYEGDGIPLTTPTAQSDQHDIWLSPRLPTAVDNAGVISAVIWPTIGILPVPLPNEPHFDIPGGGGTYSIRSDTTAANTPNSHYRLEFALNGDGPTWWQQKRTTDTPPISFHIGADADGDGIVDSGFFKLPVGELDGVTYYAAMRIIDNNSAVNVNTAYSSTADLDFTPLPALPNNLDALGNPVSGPAGNLGMFRSHIGLFEMLHDPNNEMKAINAARFNGVSPTATAYDKTGQPITGVTFVTQGDMMDHQIADQIRSPGYISASKAFTPFDTSDAQALAYHFTLANLSASRSNLESKLLSSGAATFDSVIGSAMNYATLTPNSSAKGRDAYPNLGNAYWYWYDENFNYAGETGPASPSRAQSILRPLRALLTTYNPVSNQVLPRTQPNGAPVALPDLAAMTPYRTTPAQPGKTAGQPVKTNVNTAGFGELYRAYWSVMADNLGAGGTGTPFPIVQAPDPTYGVFLGMQFDTSSFAADPDPAHVNPQYMFRSTVRDPTAGSPIMERNSDELLIRAASAAVNTMYLRNNTNTAPQPITLSNADTVQVFPMQPQPFITEVFAYFEKGDAQNTVPYVAIKFFNPFPVPVPLGNNTGLIFMPRKSGSYTLPLTQANLNRSLSFPAVTIAPHSFFVIDNKGSGITLPPTAAGTLPGAGANYQAVANLDRVLNNEMMLVTNRSSSVPTSPLSSMQVLDSFDFTGFDRNAIAGPNGAGAAWHYARAHDLGANLWRCVYPGRYDAHVAPGLTSPRQQGTETTAWASSNANTWKTGSWSSPNGQSSGPSFGTAVRPSPLGSTFPGAFSIQLAFNQFNGVGAQAGAGPNGGKGQFPFGGFARNGDILQVPFIAAHTIMRGGGLIEANSIAMDAAFAEDSDTADDTAQQAPPVPGGMQEQIGRFCPLTKITTAVGGLVDDFDTTTTPSPNRYAWARRLFDYLTVQSPGTDYMPNDPTMIATGTAQPVDNDGDKTAGVEDGAPPPTAPTGYTYTVGAEDTIGVQGLININTAPWKVLAAIPWVPKGQVTPSFWPVDPVAGQDDNDKIAQTIVFWRDGDPTENGSQGHGAFKSIFDLYSITIPDPSGVLAPSYMFQALQNKASTPEPSVAQGDFSGADGSGTQPDQIRNDFDEQYLILTKVSNLLTTRSDTFTVYILLQGWRGVGGSAPTKVVERRAAMIIDRTSATKDNPANIRRWDLSND
jgi:hypothetical protein